MKTLLKQAVLATAMGTGVLAGTLIPTSAAYADSQSYKQLSGDWLQWVLSIPEADNPLADTTGENCMIGQRGGDWFLAGTFGAASATRSCTIPEGVSLFFPVANFFAFDNPGACGQVDPIPLAVWRGWANDWVDGVTKATVVVDGKPFKPVQRIQSQAFAVAMPEDNLFNGPFICGGTLPAGIYSPAIDDGYFARVNPLAVGTHTVVIHAENPSNSFTLDVTYNLTVVPVVTK